MNSRVPRRQDRTGQSSNSSTKCILGFEADGKKSSNNRKRDDSS